MALVATLACNSHYTPRRSAFVHMTMEAGQPVVVKNGMVYPMGIAGAGLVEAVRDNPRASLHAEAHQQGIATGLVALLGGAIVISVSPIALLINDGNGGQPTGDQISVFSGLLLAGLGLYVFGAASLAAAQPRIYDAINQYNDDLLFGGPQPALPPVATPAPAP